jgi:hypothetical protein
MSCTRRYLSKWRYIRTGDLAENLDIKTYDLGNLEIIGNFDDASAVAGELYVEYDVEFRMPQRSLDAVGAVNLATENPVSGTQPFAAISPTGLISVVKSIGDIAFRPITGTTAEILEKGQYLLQLCGSAASIATPATPAVSKGTIAMEREVYNAGGYLSTWLLDVLDNTVLTWDGFSSSTPSSWDHILTRLPMGYVA